MTPTNPSHVLVGDAPATLVDLFETAARHNAERPARVSFGAQLAFREIADHARAIASGLQRIGMKKGERVAIFAPNVMASAPILFGVLAGGFVATILHPASTSEALVRQLNGSGARVAFVLNGCAHLIYAALEELETLERAIIVSPGDLSGWRGVLANLSLRYVKRRVKPYTLPATLPFAEFVDWGAGQALKPAGVEPDDPALLRFPDPESAQAEETSHAQAARAAMEYASWMTERLQAGAPRAIACSLSCATRTGLFAQLAAFHLGATTAALMDGEDPMELTKALSGLQADVLALEPAHYERLTGWGPAREALRSVSVFLSEETPAAEIAEKWSQTYGRPIEAAQA